MTREPRTDGRPSTLYEEQLEWIAGHETELRGWVSGQHFLYLSLGIGLVLGLAAHIAGYALGTWTSTEPIGIAADLLYALGLALWTGVVVVVFAQVIPEAKRRQVARYLEEYEAARHEQLEGDAASERVDERRTEGPRPG